MAGVDPDSPCRVVAHTGAAPVASPGDSGEGPPSGASADPEAAVGHGGTFCRC